MEIPVKMKHLKKCRKDECESFVAYVKRFQTISSQMKETTDIKEVVKICAMKVGHAASFLNGAQCNTFEQLFERILVYEELGSVSTLVKNVKASSILVTDLRGLGRDVPQEKSKNNEGQNGAPRQN